MSGTIPGVGAPSPATAADTATHNPESWAAATQGAGTASAQAAEQKQVETQMIGQIGTMAMMPVIMQAMNAGQDDG